MESRDSGTSGRHARVERIRHCRSEFKERIAGVAIHLVEVDLRTGREMVVERDDLHRPRAAEEALRQHVQIDRRTSRLRRRDHHDSLLDESLIAVSVEPIECRCGTFGTVDGR